jgi:surface antigen
LLACGNQETGRLPLYNGTGALRLCRPPHRLVAVLAVLGAVAVGGCSLPLDSMFDKSGAEVDQTGSTAPSDRTDRAAAAAPSETDLNYARAAAAEAIARGAKDSSIPWANPQTGAGGNITPLAVSYNEGALVCRDFLASYARGPSQAWLRGEACHAGHGKWEVRSLKPLSRG